MQRYYDMYRRNKIKYINLIGGADYNADANKYLQALERNILPTDIISCLLVKNKLRNAYLIQTIDNTHKTIDMPTYLATIKEIFKLDGKLVEWHNNSWLVSDAESLAKYDE